MNSLYRTDINRGVRPAAADEFAAVQLGALSIWPPVVLAPMAGVTNFPFRSLCNRFGAGLCVSEMVTARPLVEGQAKTHKLASFGPGEYPRSLQLYGVDHYYVGEAVRMLVGEGRVDHVDLNFGCPVRKVTSRGGGAAVPLRPRLLARIARAAVDAAGAVPVTMKFRTGLDEQHLNYQRTGKVAEQAGCAAVTLHARTAAQLYDGAARWEAIAELKGTLGIPVLGNGDVWEAFDALRMMRQTGCDGVVVGRGCLGRPWLFRDLQRVYEGGHPPDPPCLGQVAATMLEHASLLRDWIGEAAAMRSFRRHATWYTKGFRNSAELRQQLMRVETMKQLEQALQQVNPDEPFPAAALRLPRGKGAGQQRVSLPPELVQALSSSDPVADDTWASGG